MMYKGEIKIMRGPSGWLPTSSSKPPYNHEEPKDNDEKHDVPKPATALPRSHVVHSSECP